VGRCFGKLVHIMNKVNSFPPKYRLTRLLKHCIANLHWPPPFNRWLFFYKPAGKGVVIKRVLYGNVTRRQAPGRFF